MRLASRTTQLSGSKTSGARNKAEALRSRGIDIVNFAAGELDLAPPEALLHSLRAATTGTTNLYTDTAGLPQLREALAARISRLSGVSCAPADVLVTTGAKHGLYLACLALLDSGDEVLIPHPAWGTFPAQVMLAGAVPVAVATEDTGFIPDLERLERLRTPRTRMVILNTPNNPTGIVYPPAVLAGIAEWAVRHQLWIVFDECYGELVLPGAVHGHPAAAVPAAAAHTVTVGSFSKSFAVTGWRAGYVRAPAAVISAMKNLQSHTTSNVTSVVQYALLPAARGELDGFVAEVRDVLRRRHAAVRAAVDGIEQITAVDPQGAFYFFLDFSSVIGRKLRGAPIPDSDAIAAFLVEEVGVALTPGSAFGSKSHLRLSYAIAEDRIIEGLSRLREVMSRVE